ncbi:KH domain-containing protein, partial [Patescibacteria group bacterium]|nr:KH domain-containing protein [Patescibacteria group bacterium]
MFNKKKEKVIKKIAEEFFKKTSFSVDIEVEEKDDSSIDVNLKTDEPQVLIGEGGKTLACFQTLLSKVARRKFESPLYLNLDINEYKKKKLEYLKDIARNYADEVSLSKTEKELAPMPAYERRIIHIELKERSDVSTESRGYNLERKVVIKP